MNLKQAAFSAGRWTTASAAGVSILQALQLAVLARLLDPAAFGLMAIAAAVLAVLTLIADLGLNQAVIHYDDMPATHLSSLYWSNLGVAAALMLLVATFAPVASVAYKSPSLAPLLQWMSLLFPISAAAQQLRALASKALRFDKLASIEIAATFIGCVCAIMAALSGAGVYALVIGALVTAGSSSCLTWLMLPSAFRPGLHFEMSEVRPYIGFGSYLVGERMTNTLRRDADVFVSGLVLGPAAVGIYSVPRDLCLRLGAAVNSVMIRVGFPVMARVKNDPERLKYIYLQALRMTASVNFPIYVAVGVFAGDIVAIYLGEQWLEAETYLRILAAWGLVRSTTSPVGSLLYAAGRTKRAFWWNATLLLLLPVLYWLAVKQSGLLGLALSITAIQIALVLPAWRYLVFPCCGARAAEYCLPLLVPLATSLLSGVLTWIAIQGVSNEWIRLAMGGGVYAASYLALSWRFNREWATAMLQLMRLGRPNASRSQ